MTNKNLKNSVKDLAAAQRKLVKANKSITKLAAKSNSIELKGTLGQQTLKKRISKKNWKTLKTDSSKRYKEYEKKMDDLIRLADSRSKAISSRNILLKKLNPVIKPVKKIKNWKKIKAGLKLKLKEKGVNPNRVYRFIKNIEGTDFKKFNDLYKRTEAGKNDSMRSAFNKLLKAYMFQYYTYCCAQTNMNKGSKISLSSVRSKVNAQEKAVSKNYRTVKDLLKAENKVISNCKILEKTISNNIEKNLLPLALELYKTRTPGKKIFGDCLELSLTAGMLIRRSFLLLAACKRFRFLYTNKNITSDFKRWLNSSSIRSIEQPRAVKPVSFGRLANGGASFSKKQIALKGRVMKIEIRHAGRKPISHAFITDGKYIAVATIPHIKIDSGGMSPGAYVEVAGEWQQRNKEAFNKPSLAVSRIDHTKASKKSWLSWLTIEMNDVYRIMPHSINASISWKPGRSGAINSVKFSTI
jgi:hypothetical protein